MGYIKCSKISLNYSCIKNTNVAITVSITEDIICIANYYFRKRIAFI